MRQVPSRLQIWMPRSWRGVTDQKEEAFGGPGGAGAFEEAVIDALRSNRCSVAIVRAESRVVDEVRRDWGRSCRFR